MYNMKKKMSSFFYISKKSKEWIKTGKSIVSHIFLFYNRITIIENILTGHSVLQIPVRKKVGFKLPGQ